MLVFLSLHRNHSIFLAGEFEGAEVQLSAVALIEIVNLLVGSGIGSGTSGFKKRPAGDIRTPMRCAESG